MRLSILDFQTPAGAIELARVADALGFHRYWLGEHHSQYQCANPLLLATVLAGLTERIRVGTGGVCLTYNNPYRVAEDARLASYLFPDRFDLGVARGLPYEPALWEALAGRDSEAPAEPFDGAATALHQYVTGRLPSGHPLAGTPLYLEPGPPVWILGGSPASARLAGGLGAGFCVSLHHQPRVEAASAALAEYAASFSPSPEFPRPAAMVVVSGVCGESAAAAAALAEGIRAAPGEGGPAGGGSPFFGGGPAECAAQLAGLAARLEVEEVMVLDLIAGQWEARVRMYELLAGALGLDAGG